MHRSFPIVTVCKADILEAFTDDDRKNKIMRAVKKMSDEDMKQLARKLADDYCEQLFWESLRTIFEYRFLDKGKDNNKHEQI